MPRSRAASRRGAAPTSWPPRNSSASSSESSSSGSSRGECPRRRPGEMSNSTRSTPAGDRRLERGERVLRRDRRRAAVPDHERAAAPAARGSRRGAARRSRSRRAGRRLRSPAGREHGVGDLLRRGRRCAGEHLVEPLEPEELAPRRATRSRRRCRARPRRRARARALTCSYICGASMPSASPPHASAVDASVRPDEPRLRMPGARAEHLARRDRSSRTPS